MATRKDGTQGGPALPTAPAQETGLALAPRESPVALRVLGSDVADIPLALARRTFVVGSDGDDPDVTVRINSTMKDPRAREEVSRVHLMIQRRGAQLWIKDQSSTNGTYLKDARIDEGYVTAGDTFRLGRGPGAVTVLVMDEEMTLLRPSLQWALGFTAHARVDDVLQRVLTDAPLLLLGVPGCEQRWLAEQIHHTSPRRFRGFAPIGAPLSNALTPLAVATQGSVFLDLASFEKIPAPFVKELFGDTYRVRPIIAAPSLDRAMTQLGKGRVHTMTIVDIPTVRQRREDVPRILNTMFRRPPMEKKRDVAELGAKAVAALTAFDWPDNFDDLRRNAPRILALIESGGNKRGAARLLDQKHQSVNKALARIGL